MDYEEKLRLAKKALESGSYDKDTIEYHFLTFHTAEQRDLFLAENERLVKDFLMID